MEKRKRRTLTSPGLGDSGLRARQTLPTVPPISGVRERETSDVSATERRSTRPPRSSRAPVRVDDVGDAAVAIAAKHGRISRAVVIGAPKVLRTRQQLEEAPINHRDAFVLSLIDGKTSVQGVVDLAAMPEGEVLAILDRLAALGIVSLP